MTQVWIVLLEAAASRHEPRVETPALETLLSLLQDYAPSALYAPDRYALQLAVPAIDPTDALDEALAQWRTAALLADLPRWRLARLEVKTVEELDAEYDANEHEVSPSFDGEGMAAAYRCTRALLAARTPNDVVVALSLLVTQLGGEVMPAARRHPDAMPVDLSFGEGEPLVPVAERLSVTRLRLEELLPIAVEDARRAITSLRRESLAVPTPTH